MRVYMISCPVKWLIEVLIAQYEHTLSICTLDFLYTFRFSSNSQSIQNSELSEKEWHFLHFHCFNSSNNILQLERAVRALYFIGTSVRSRITRSGREGARGARLARARPWERSAFNVSHVLETLLPRREHKRDAQRATHEPDKDATRFYIQMKAKKNNTTIK